MTASGHPVPPGLAALAAALGGLITAGVLLFAVLSLAGFKTSAAMLPLTASLVVLPLGLITLAAGFYVARRIWASLRDEPGTLDVAAPDR
jgi:hypothetical protein